MKKLLLFFSKPIVGGILSLIGLLEILFSIPSSYITYPIPLWIIVLAIGLVILFPYLWKRLRILYYIRNYTSDSFGGSCLYKWCWTRTSDKFNVYGYFPIRIDVVENVKLDPNSNHPKAPVLLNKKLASSSLASFFIIEGKHLLHLLLTSVVSQIV